MTDIESAVTKREGPGRPPEIPQETREMTARELRELVKAEREAVMKEIEELTAQTAAIVSQLEAGNEDVIAELEPERQTLLADLQANAAEMTEAVETADAEVRVVLEGSDTVEKINEVRGLLEKAYKPLRAVFDGLPDQAKNDSELLFEAFENVQASLEGSVENESLREKLEILPDDATFSLFAEQFIDATTNIDEPTKAGFFARLAEKNPRIVVEALKQAPMHPENRHTALLGVANSPEGSVAIEKNPELFADVGRADLAGALAEYAPEKALEVLKSSGSSELGRLDSALAIVVFAPKLAKEVLALDFSEGEKLALALRLCKKNPDIALRVVRELQIDFSEAEKIGIAQDLIESDRALFKDAVKEFRLSGDTVIGIISAYPREKQVEFLNSLDIPGHQGKEVRKLITSLENDPAKASETEKKEFTERQAIDAAKNISRELLVAIESAFPDRIALLRRSAETEKELHREMEKAQELGGISWNAPKAVTLEGRLLPAVYKARIHEKPELRAGVAKDSMAQREWLAFQVDRAFGLDVVPPTVLRDGPDGIGALQDWKIGDLAYQVRPGYAEVAAKGQLMRTAFLDVLIENTDRHHGNFLVDQKGRVHAIDNGYAFAPPAEGIRSAPLRAVRFETVPQDLRLRADAFRSSPDVARALRKAFDLALGEESETAWSHFMAKLDTLSPPLSSGMETAFPDADWISFDTLAARVENRGMAPPPRGPEAKTA